MPVERLEHINTRSADVEATREFYTTLLGLTVGDRPPFASTGYWLYLNGEPIIHLVQRPAGESPQAGSGNVDHIAFRGGNLEATRAMLQTAGVLFREQIVPRDGTVQIFVHDPDGIKIEINFPS